VTDTITGRVEARNERGIRIGEDWFNRSQFAPVELPDAGAQVRVKVDSRGYIKELENLSPPTTPAVLSPKDDRITRLAVLKAAAAFGASRPDCKSGDVLLIADKWLAWVEGE